MIIRKLFQKGAGRAIAVAALLVSAAVPATAQDFPSRSVRMVVVSSPGGGGDTAARTLAPVAAKALGQDIVVENMPGAAGALAIRAVAESPPDGYTIYFTQSDAAFGSVFNNDESLDIQKHLTPITMLANSGLYLVANSTLGLKTLDDMIAYAKAHPGELNFSSTGPTAITNTFMNAVRQKYAIDVENIYYSDAGRAATALQTNEVQLMFIGARRTLLAIESSYGTPLAVAAPKRTDILPDVAAFSDLGVQGVDGQDWMLFGVAGTPKPVIDKLNAAFVSALQDPAVAEALGKIGLDVIGSTPEVLGKRYADQVTFFSEIAKNAGPQ